MSANERIIFAYDNLIAAASLTASSESASFPAANLKNPFRTKPWRTAGLTPGTAQLVINHGSAKAVNFIALTGYNWASAPATLQVEFNDADAWGAPAATEALTWAASPATNGHRACIVKKLAVTRTYQYNRLSVVYGTGDWDLGILFLGALFQPASQFLLGHRSDLIDPSLLSKSVGGQDFADELEKYRRLGFNFIVSTETEAELFLKMANAVGLTRDLFIAFDYTQKPNENTVYGKFRSLPGLTVPFRYNLSFTYEESR